MALFLIQIEADQASSGGWLWPLQTPVPTQLCIIGNQGFPLTHMNPCWKEG